MIYRLKNTTTGEDLGTVEADDEIKALDKWARSEMYGSYADYIGWPSEEGDDIEVTECAE